MFARIRRRCSYANVMSTIAVLFALGTGGAYAANTIGSSDVIDESLQSQDIKNGQVKHADLAGNSVTSTNIYNGSVLGPEIHADAVDASKIAGDAVGSSEIATDAVQASEVADNSIDAGEIVDFGLSNQDVGVLFAEVTGTGTLDNSSGGVTAGRVGATGSYEVDFGHDVSNCAAVATIGPSTGGSADGETNVADRAGNAEAVFVRTATSAGAAADKPFRLVVVC